MGASLPAGSGSRACAQPGTESAPGTVLDEVLGSLQLWSATQDMGTAVLPRVVLHGISLGVRVVRKTAEGLGPLASSPLSDTYL